MVAQDPALQDQEEGHREAAVMCKQCKQQQDIDKSIEQSHLGPLRKLYIAGTASAPSPSSET